MAYRQCNHAILNVTAAYKTCFCIFIFFIPSDLRQPLTTLLTLCGHTRTNRPAGQNSPFCLFTPQAQQALVLGGKDIPLFLRNILWRVAASGANEGGMGHGDGSDAAARPSSSSSSSPSSSPSPSPEVFRSPQLLRFAAHLALVLAAQCPYLTTMEEETVEAIEDVVFAYTQHLAKTHQVGWHVLCLRMLGGWAFSR